MTFYISEMLLVERAIVVSATILLFGLVSTGGLWLLRRNSVETNASSSELGRERQVDS
jgi:hypothetical protein